MTDAQRPPTLHAVWSERAGEGTHPDYPGWRYTLERSTVERGRWYGYITDTDGAILWGLRTPRPETLVRGLLQRAVRRFAALADARREHEALQP